MQQILVSKLSENIKSLKTFLKKKDLFIYFFFSVVDFFATCELSLVVTSRGYSSLWWVVLLQGFLLLWSTGSR